MRLFILLFLVSPLFYAQSKLVNGPMVGYCEMKEAVIWLQTQSSSEVFIEYYEVDLPKKIYKTATYKTIKDNAFVCHALLDQLMPGKKYNYSVFIDKKKVNLDYETSFSSKKLWQWREDAPNFTVAFGSCSYVNEEALDRPGRPYGSDYSIFESISKKNPDIMLWGGDNIYLREADWDNKTGIYHRYTHSRKIKELQPLLAKTQNFAIWDDHDFGPNDSDRSYYNKYTTQQAFKDFWANKFYGIDKEQSEGVFSSFNWSDVEFFLLDDRFFKSPNDKKTGEKVLLGKTQIDWLIDAMVSSKASFKIVVVGGQVLNTAAVYENYENYKEEKAYFLSELSKNKIKGVMFLSGDRHFSELSEQKRENDYSLYDWTVSPLTSGFGNLEKLKKEENTNRVENSIFAQHVFGTLSFSGDKENRQVKLSLYDKEGNELWNKTLLKKELQ